MTTEAHVIYVDQCIAAVEPMSGLGLLALPVDMRDPFTGQDVRVDMGRVLAKLDSLGIEPLWDNDDLPCEEADLSSGRRVYGLYVRESIVARPEWGELDEANTACRAALEAVVCAYT